MLRPCCPLLVLALYSTAEAAAFTAADADRLLAAEWQRRGIRPARPADDATFLRRAYLDLTGTLPPPEEVTAFLANTQSPTAKKRALLIEKLLASPRYAEHFTDYWEAVLFGRARRGGDIDREAFRAWFRARLADNLGWDKLVYELITATGVNSVGGKRDPKESPPPVPDFPSGPNGAVNFLLRFAGQPQDLAGVVAREFLGIQIQCAQCHNHPTEKWRQEDFRSFAACFVRTRVRTIDTGKVVGIRRMEVLDTPRPVGGAELADIVKARPRALDGTDLSDSDNPRRAVAAWMTAAKNPWFARELVNRYWAYLVGRGFAEPVDDLRPANPLTMPALLDALAQEFVRAGYDLRHLIRLICATRAYQLSAGPALDRDAEHRLWSRYRLRPLSALELFDALVAATGFGRTLEAALPGSEELSRLRDRLRQSVAFVFDVDEEADGPQQQGTVQQALWLLNGSLVASAVMALPGSALEEVLKKGDDRERVTTLFLRTLSRPPTRAELDHFVAFVNAPRELVPDPVAPLKGQRQRPPPARRPVAPDPLRGLQGRLRPREQGPRQQAYEDLLWALVNSSEFVFRH
jgi:hypothetical protein